MSRPALAWALLAAAAGALLLGAPYASGWPVDNRLETWADRGDGDYEVLRDAFGGDEFLLARVDHFRPEDAAQAAWVDGLHGRLAALPAVRAVLDPLHLPGGAADGGVRERLEAAAARPLVAALDAVRLDPPRIDVVLDVASTATPAERAGLARALEELRAEAAAREVRLRAAGHPLVAAALDVEARRVEETFGPLFALAGLAASALVLRSLWLGLVTMLPAALGSIGTRAALRALDVPANMILVAVGPLVLVLMVASVLHQVAAFRRFHAAGLERAEAAARAWRAVFPTALLAGATTAAGFAVFGLAPVRAVRELGLAAAAAVLVAVPLAHLAVPVWLAGLPVRRPRDPRDTASRTRLWRSAAVALTRRGRVLSAGSLAVLAACIAAVPGIPFGTNSVDYFPDGHPIREAFLSVEAEGGALSGLDVLVEREADSVDRAGELSASLRGAPGVAGVFGPDTVRADVRRIAGPLAGALEEGALARGGRTDADARWLRFTVRAATGGSAQTRALADELARRARDWAGDARTVVTGSVVELLGVQGDLVGTLAGSLCGTAAFVAACFLLAVRDVRRWLAAMYVNVWPVGIVLGVARLAGHGLDAATVMVASVVMGIAVDNTFHLLRAGGSGRGTRRELRAFERVGDAAATSTLALAAGFGLLAASPFAPTARFGLLAGVGVVAAFVSDFGLLPGLLAARPRRIAPATAAEESLAALAPVSHR